MSLVVRSLFFCVGFTVLGRRELFNPCSQTDPEISAENGKTAITSKVSE